MRARLTLPERWLLAASNYFYARSNGYRVPFSGELIRTVGWAKTGEFSRRSEGILKNAVSLFGERDTQVLSSMAALWNGCPFCSVGHMLAANLLHLRDTEQLFAIPESAVVEWRRLRDEEILADVATRLGSSEERLSRRVRRGFELYADPNAPLRDDEDHALDAMRRLWAIVSECSVHFEISPEDIPPLAKIALDKPLRARYQKLRG